MTTTPTASPELLDLDKLEALARAATPGPWAYQEDSDVYTHIVRPVQSPGNIVRHYAQDTSGVVEANARFTAGANPAAVLALIALARRAKPEGEAPQADAAVMVPKFKGQFDSHQDWVNRAQRVLSVPSHKPSAICVDAKGRRCHIGADMKRASEEGTFPVRYFWECELTTPAATLSPLCGAQHAESGKESIRQHEAIEASVDQWYPKRDSPHASVNDKIGAARLAFRKGYRAALAAQQAAAPGPAHGTIVREGDNLVCTACGTSAPGTPEAPKPPFPISDDEMAALRRFWECATDGEGYDVEKAMMQRLAEMGLVQRKSGAYYMATDFGLYVLGEYTIQRAAQLDGSQGEGQ